MGLTLIRDRTPVRCHQSLLLEQGVLKRHKGNQTQWLINQTCDIQNRIIYTEVQITQQETGKKNKTQRSQDKDSLETHLDVQNVMVELFLTLISPMNVIIIQK